MKRGKSFKYLRGLIDELISKWDMDYPIDEAEVFMTTDGGKTWFHLSHLERLESGTIIIRAGDEN